MGAYRNLLGAVETAAAELVNGEIGLSSWDALAAAVGPGPLAALIAEIRSTSS